MQLRVTVNVLTRCNPKFSKKLKKLKILLVLILVWVITSMYEISIPNLVEIRKVNLNSLLISPGIDPYWILIFWCSCENATRFYLRASIFLGGMLYIIRPPLHAACILPDQCEIASSGTYVHTYIHTYYRCNDTQFGCIDILPLVYHDTAIYCMIQSSVN